MGVETSQGEEVLVRNEEHFHVRVHHQTLRREFYADIPGMRDQHERKWGEDLWGEAIHGLRFHTFCKSSWPLIV